MIAGIRLKICGITSLVDAEYAGKAEADALGFILHAKSPRHITLAAYRAMAGRLPESCKRVAVMVEPSLSELAGAVEAGFDFFQTHYNPLTVGIASVTAWSHTVGVGRLWLAPKLPPGTNLPVELLPLANTILMDTFKPEGFGGTGKIGDWAGFACEQAKHLDKTWILAGGLNPENITEALAQSGAKFVDVNSGVEAAPGVKNHEKIKKLVVAIYRARTEAQSMSS